MEICKKIRGKILCILAKRHTFSFTFFRESTKRSSLILLFLIYFFLFSTTLFAQKTPKISGKSLIDRISIPSFSFVFDSTASVELNQTEEGSDTQDIGKNTANIREVEIGINGAVDPWVAGTILLSAHQEGSEVNVALEEGYFELTSLPWKFFAKIGQFFLDLGRLNGNHRSNWSFTQAPLTQSYLFGNGNVGSFGGEISYLVPLPFFQEVKVGLFNMIELGHEDAEHEHEEDTEADEPSNSIQPPLFTIRLKNFFPLTSRMGSIFGFTYLGLPGHSGTNDFQHTGGIDSTLKWNHSRRMQLEWSTEFWYRNEEVGILPAENSFGYYSFISFQPFLRWKFGFRWDHFLFLGQGNNIGQKNRHDFSQSLWVSFHLSEYFYCRITLERQDYSERSDSYLMLFQAGFTLGEHPTHSY